MDPANSVGNGERRIEMTAGSASGERDDEFIRLRFRYCGHASPPKMLKTAIYTAAS
jgi:hypothetical protein